VKVIIESSLPDLKNITSIMPIRRYLNLCEKLEVLLNNAIEAASESQDKYIKIEIEKPLKNKLKSKF
jgi:hypothetical protein